jgi:pimeloyl-ACP methyl ester carboxylesterase
MDALGIQRAGLAGYSYGGLVALGAALGRPERVGALALIDAPQIDQRDLDATAADLGNRDAAERAIDRHLAGLGLATGFGAARGLGASLGASLVSGLGAAFGAEMGADRKRQAAEGLCRLYGGGRLADDMRRDMGFLAEAPLERLASPALLLYGNRSPYIGAGHDIERRIPGAALKVGRGDHNLPVQSGAWVGKRLLRFFASQSDAGAIRAPSAGAP